MNNIAIGNFMMMAKFFLAFYFITLILYHYLTRDVKAKMDKISAKNSIAVSNKLYELKQEGNRKAKFTYIVYITRCAFRNIGKKIVHLIKKSYIYLTTNHLNT